MICFDFLAFFPCRAWQTCLTIEVCSSFLEELNCHLPFLEIYMNVPRTVYPSLCGIFWENGAEIRIIQTAKGCNPLYQIGRELQNKFFILNNYYSECPPLRSDILTSTKEDMSSPVSVCWVECLVLLVSSPFSLAPFHTHTVRCQVPSVSASVCFVKSTVSLFCSIRKEGSPCDRCGLAKMLKVNRKGHGSISPFMESAPEPPAARTPELWTTIRWLLSVKQTNGKVSSNNGLSLRWENSHLLCSPRGSIRMWTPQWVFVTHRASTRPPLRWQTHESPVKHPVKVFKWKGVATLSTETDHSPAAQNILQ